MVAHFGIAVVVDVPLGDVDWVVRQAPRSVGHTRQVRETLHKPGGQVGFTVHARRWLVERLSA